MKIPILLLSVLLSNVICAQAQWFKPTLSIYTLYTSTRDYNQIYSGVFEINTRTINLGYELKNDFPLFKNAAISLGLRYIPYSTKISGLNLISSRHNKPDPIIWNRKFGALTIPISYTNSFNSRKSIRGAYFIGVGLGVFFANYEKVEIKSSAVRNIGNRDTVTYQVFGTGELQKSQFISSIDFGANFQPFKRMNQLKLGMVFSYPINILSLGTIDATTSTTAGNQKFFYNADVAQKLINMGLSISYQFNTRQENKQ